MVSNNPFLFIVFRMQATSAEMFTYGLSCSIINVRNASFINRSAIGVLEKGSWVQSRHTNCS